MSGTGELLTKKPGASSGDPLPGIFKEEMAGNDMTLASDRTLHSECNIFASKETRDPMEEQ
jgi:hypothetical protein